MTASSGIRYEFTRQAERSFSVEVVTLAGGTIVECGWTERAKGYSCLQESLCHINQRPTDGPLPGERVLEGAI